GDHGERGHQDVSTALRPLRYDACPPALESGTRHAAVLQGERNQQAKVDEQRLRQRAGGLAIQLRGRREADDEAGAINGDGQKRGVADTAVDERQKSPQHEVRSPVVFPGTLCQKATVHTPRPSRAHAGILPGLFQDSDAMAHRVVQFGSFRFDCDTGQLWSDAQELRLTRKAAAVLGALIGGHGQPVEKRALFDTVWKGTVVSDDALTSCIQELRRALQDDSRNPRYIETRHRSGYRFIASLTEIPPESAAAPHISTIAVLPFTDMSPGRDQDYLCEGLAEELINVLTRLDGLRVVSRTASFQFRASGMDVRDIGRQLNVGALLEGSVRKSGNQLRVTVQLIDVATGYHRWSERFDRELADVFAIEDEIAESVATTLRGSMLSSRERHALVRPGTGSAAYEYYLRGRQHLPRMTQPDLLKSAAMFERAIQLDSSYAPAYAGLATVHATLHEWFGARAEDLAKAESASLRALELAPGLAETHAARGFVFTLSRRYASASQAFEEAIRINPNLFDAYYYFARAAFANGHLELSADLFGRAAQVRVEDFQSVALQAQSLQWLGRQE